MYIFIRQDLPLQHQLVQSNHATFHLASLYRCDSGVPNIIVLGVPDVRSLERAAAKLREHAIPHYEWREPDFDFGFTSMATAPLDYKQRQVLSNYRVWNHARGPGQPACGLTADPRATVQGARSSNGRAADSNSVG